MMRLPRIVWVFLLLVFIPVLADGQKTWYDPMVCDTPYVSGRAWNTEIGKVYHRFPERMKGKVTDAVWNLSKQCAGLSVRFLSDAHEIVVRYVLASGIYSYLNMPVLGHSGIDLYGTDADGKCHWIGNHMKWKYGAKAGDTITVTFPEISFPNYQSRGLEYELFLPPYNTVTDLQIGVPAGSSFAFQRESEEKPVVIYGTSIVQGASPSRPGLMWTTIVRREMDYPVVNMGFSGSAKMEKGLFEALSEIDARIFILDPLPNCVGMSEDELVKRAVDGIKILRKKSKAPILMMENYPAPDSVLLRIDYMKYVNANMYYRKAYEQLNKEGVTQLYYMYSREINFSEDAMIEGVHPNDLGNRAYADAVEAKLHEIFEHGAKSRYSPVRQHRDGGYEWLCRHNEVIRLNREIAPEILMIGDEMMQIWGGEPASQQNGRDSWDELFEGRRAVNMGFGWDRIENVFWRIFHGELEGCKAKHICLCIGINNSGDKVEKIAQGVVDLAQLIRQRQPAAKLHVIKILPAKHLEALVKDVNMLIEMKLKTDEMTDLIDLTDELTLPDGRINMEMFVEGVHPGEKGYERIAKVLKKIIK